MPGHLEYTRSSMRHMIKGAMKFSAHHADADTHVYKYWKELLSRMGHPGLFDSASHPLPHPLASRLDSLHCKLLYTKHMPCLQPVSHAW